MHDSQKWCIALIETLPMPSRLEILLYLFCKSCGSLYICLQLDRNRWSWKHFCFVSIGYFNKEGQTNCFLFCSQSAISSECWWNWRYKCQCTCSYAQRHFSKKGFNWTTKGRYWCGEETHVYFGWRRRAGRNLYFQVILANPGYCTTDILSDFFSQRWR